MLAVVPSRKCSNALSSPGAPRRYPERMPEPRLAGLLYPESGSHPGSLEYPDWAVIHIELRKKGVT